MARVKTEKSVVIDREDFAAAKIADGVHGGICREMGWSRMTVGRLRDYMRNDERQSAVPLGLFQDAIDSAIADAPRRAGLSAERRTVPV